MNEWLQKIAKDTSYNTAQDAYYDELNKLIEESEVSPQRSELSNKKHTLRDLIFGTLGGAGAASGGRALIQRFSQTPVLKAWGPKTSAIVGGLLGLGVIGLPKLFGRTKEDDKAEGSEGQDVVAQPLADY